MSFGPIDYGRLQEALGRELRRLKEVPALIAIFHDDFSREWPKWYRNRMARATFCVTTDWVTDWSVLDKLHDWGNEIAAHSKSHKDLVQLYNEGKFDEIEEEIRVPYEILKTRYGDCRTWSFPYNSLNRPLMEWVARYYRQSRGIGALNGVFVQAYTPLTLHFLYGTWDSIKLLYNIQVTGVPKTVKAWYELIRALATFRGIAFIYTHAAPPGVKTVDEWELVLRVARRLGVEFVTVDEAVDALVDMLRYKYEYVDHYLRIVETGINLGLPNFYAWHDPTGYDETEDALYLEAKPGESRSVVCRVGLVALPGQTYRVEGRVKATGDGTVRVGSWSKTAPFDWTVVYVNLVHDGYPVNIGFINVSVVVEGGTETTRVYFKNFYIKGPGRPRLTTDSYLQVKTV